MSKVPSMSVLVHRHKDSKRRLEELWRNPITRCVYRGQIESLRKAIRRDAGLLSELGLAGL